MVHACRRRAAIVQRHSELRSASEGRSEKSKSMIDDDERKVYSDTHSPSRP